MLNFRFWNYVMRPTENNPELSADQLGRIHEGLAQADEGNFVADDEMEAFFASHGAEGVELAKSSIT